MNQKDKSQQSKDRIITSAILEFGNNKYANASLNNICKDNNISKGLIYHYFKNKDELFLLCVKKCFNSICTYLIENDCEMVSIENYLKLRYEFFESNPKYSTIFFNAIIDPPSHLKSEIKKLRSDFDEINFKYYKSTLSKLTLRDNITEDEAMEYFWIFQEMFNGYYQNKSYESTNFNELIKDHEIKLLKLLNIMVYGIAKEES